MAGAPSQLDLFDYKPELAKLEGKPLPPSVIGGQRYAFIRPDAAVLGPRFKFAKHGQSGAELSEMLPHLAKIVDDICLVKSVKTDQFNHAPGADLLQHRLLATGPAVPRLVGALRARRGDAGSAGVRGHEHGQRLERRLGALVERLSADDLHRHALSQPGRSDSQCLAVPPGVDAKLQRDTLDLVGALNRQRLARDGDPEIATRLANYEMAFRLQTSAPGADGPEKRDARRRSTLYGCDPDKPSFARACLLARRMIERGVRFVNIYHEGWDAHTDVVGNHKGNCGKTDQASAALVLDLKQRGLLDDTLVIWGGEFGRTPMVETNPALGRALGRDHHPQAYTMWMAGGGVKPGLTYGATDDLGFHVVENPVHVHDLQATILHLLGFDHERLTFHHAGRDFRLTDVHGKVVKDLLA